MQKFYVMHQDEAGEWWQIGDPFVAKNSEDALRTILTQAQAEDDGRYRVQAMPRKRLLARHNFTEKFMNT